MASVPTRSPAMAQPSICASAALHQALEMRPKALRSAGASRQMDAHRLGLRMLELRARRVRVKRSRRRERMVPEAWSSRTESSFARFTAASASSNCFCRPALSAATAGASGGAFSSGFGPSCSSCSRAASSLGVRSSSAFFRVVFRGSMLARSSSKAASPSSRLPKACSICSTLARTPSSFCAATATGAGACAKERVAPSASVRAHRRRRNERIKG